MFCMLDMSFTSTAPRCRSTIDCCSGHVRPRHCSNMYSVLFYSRTAGLVAKCGAVAVLIRGNGCGRMFPTCFALRPETPFFQSQFWSYIVLYHRLPF